MTVIDEATLVDLTGELVKRPSENPPGEEGEVASYLEDRLSSSPAPFDVETYDVEPDRPNVVARAGDPAAGSILLCGHTDVVPADAESWSGDPYRMQRTDGRIVGRGVADMKGSVAAMLLAAESYVSKSDAPGEVLLAFVMGEERGGLGAEALVRRGVEADGAIVGEPTRNTIAIAEKGVVRYRVTVRGRAAHSGRPDEGVNAIDGVRRVLDRIDRLDEEARSASHDQLAPETVTVTEIEGGIAQNVVPDRVTVTVDWRTHPGRDDPEALDRRIRSAIDGVTLDGRPVDATVERLSFARGTEVSPSARIVTTLEGAASDVGASSPLTGFEAVTDARYLVHDANIPTAIFGPGSIEADAHTVDESLAVDDLVQAADVYYRTLERFFEN